MSKDQVIHAALEMAQEIGWRNVSLSAVCERAGVSLKDVFQVGSSKTEILEALLDQMRDRTLTELEGTGMEGTIRDRLFDAIMLTLEALDDMKGGIGAIANHLKRDPFTLFQLRPHLLSSMRMILESCGIDSSGVRGAVGIRIVGSVWTSTLFVWLEDDDAGLARTMAHLDRQLRRVGEWAERVPRSIKPARFEGPSPSDSDLDSSPNTYH